MTKAKKSAQNPVSDAHVKLFDEYVLKWRTLLNLRNWRIVRAAKRDPRHMASLVSVEYEHMLARYSIGTDFGSHEVTSQSLESTALHELMHLMLRPLIDVAIADGEHSFNVCEIEHAVIVVLEELLMSAYGEQPKGT